MGFVSYYGHASNTSNLGKDMHLSFIFAALVEVPAFSIPFIINYNGRRWTLFTAFLAAGAASIFYAFVPPGTIQKTSDLIESRLFLERLSSYEMDSEIK